MSTPIHVDVAMVDVLEILSGCSYLSNPRGVGFEDALKRCKAHGLVEYDKMASCGISVSGYRITQNGRVALEMAKKLRSLADERDAS